MTAVDVFWALLFIILSIALLAFARSRYGDHMTPIGIFVGVNGLSLVCYHLRMLEYNDVGIRAHIVVLTGILAFVGAVVVRLRSRPSEAVDADSGATGSPSTLLFVSLAGLAIAGWMLSLRFLVGQYGTEHLLANAWILEKEFQMQYIGYLNLAGILVLPMYVARRCDGASRPIELLLVILTLVGLLLAGIKQYIVFSSISAIVVYSLKRPGRIGVRHGLAVVGGILGFFVLYDAVIDIFGVRSFPGSRFPDWLAFLERPYLYFTGSWPAMDRLVAEQTVQQPIFGYITLQPLWKLLGDGLGLIEPVQRFLPFIDIGAHGYNVYSFIGEVYWDYGIVGVGIVSFIAGWVGGGIYGRARTTGHWGYILVYGLFSYGLVLSFFSYYYRFEMLLLMGLVAVLAFIVDPLISRRGAHGV